MNSLDYAKKLVSFESPSYLSNVPVSDYVQETLEGLGFVVERLDYIDRKGVPKSNVIGKRGSGSGGIGYFGHTDVVPADDWSLEHGPFEPTVKDDRLYGRGSCDMKGSIACMLAAAESVGQSSLSRPVYITCTADEEIGYGGADSVVERSELFHEMLQNDVRGIVGEPTMLEVVHAHKGTYGFRAISKGKAAHSSTREGLNANLAMIPFLVDMKAIHDETEQAPEWQHDEFDPPTISWNIGINDHNQALNITAPQSVCTVYYRPMPGQDGQVLLDRVQESADKYGLELEVMNRAQPLYLDPESDYVKQTIQVVGRTKSYTVSYGTDGGVFRALPNLLVLGPGSIDQAHKSDEWISLEQLDRGAEVYASLINHWCS